MVGPVPEAERLSFARRAKLALATVVGLSAGLIAVQGDASLPAVAAATGAGLGVGLVLVWVVFPGSGGTPPRGR